jgi:hypothetical protein
LLESVCSAIERHAIAASDLAQTPEEKTKTCEAALESARQVSAIVGGRFADGNSPACDLQRANILVLDQEIALRRAREVGAADAELKKLLTERRDAARKETAQQRELFRGGRAAQYAVVAAAARLSRAEVEIAATPAERAGPLAEFLEEAKQLEKFARGRFQQGNISEQEVHQATAARLAAEIELARARQAP